MPSVMYFSRNARPAGGDFKFASSISASGLHANIAKGRSWLTESSGLRGGSVEQGSALLRRANELLDSVAQRQLSARPPVTR